MVHPIYCACCACEINTEQADCIHCGSRIRQSSSTLWLLCVSACFVVAVVFQLVQHYVQDQSEIPQPPNLLMVLKEQI